MSGTCGCARVGVGLGQAFGRDWRASCPEHGRRSAWYRNGGRAYLEACRA